VEKIWGREIKTEEQIKEKEEKMYNAPHKNILAILVS
jgi:hypothetical protein